MASYDAVLLDIEGTISSQSYVVGTLFGYARARLPEFVAVHAQDPQVAQALADTRAAAEGDPVATLLRWIDEDRKIAPLKTLQGLIWDEGYASGALHGDIFPDALAALRRWRDAGVPRHVYSSGSVRGQTQFFAHSRDGDLRPLFDQHFDLATGPKTESDSYRVISRAIGHAPDRVLFLSDNPRELVAAEAAGMQVVHVVREATPLDDRFRHIGDFGELGIPA